jgi:hypothetical protein
MTRTQSHRGHPEIQDALAITGVTDGLHRVYSVNMSRGKRSPHLGHSTTEPPRSMTAGAPSFRSTPDVPGSVSGR